MLSSFLIHIFAVIWVEWNNTFCLRRIKYKRMFFCLHGELRENYEFFLIILYKDIFIFS